MKTNQNQTKTISAEDFRTLPNENEVYFSPDIEVHDIELKIQLLQTPSLPPEEW